MYDAQAIPILESEARATAHYLARVLEPVVQQQAAELAAFNPTTDDPALLRRHQNIERLLAAMQAYAAAAGALNSQLAQNLSEAEAVAQREAVRARFFLQEFKLTHADLLREQELQIQQTEAFQTYLTSRAA